jgi:hypothetical protein
MPPRAMVAVAPATPSSMVLPKARQKLEFSQTLR